MQLKLKNPMVFLDLETTGMDVARDRIVEISLIKILPNGGELVKTHRIKPAIPIPQEVTKIHGISNKDVKDCPTFRELAKELAAFLEYCDIAGYNSTKFDIPILSEEFLRAGVEFDFRARRLVDVQNIFHKLEQRTLIAAYKFYCQKDLVNAHSAEADTRATYEVLMAQLDRYPELKNDVDFLSEFSATAKNVDYAGRVVYDDKGDEVLNFGKHKGRKVADILQADPNFYDWVMRGDFTHDTKRVFTQIRLRAFGK